MSPSSTKQPVTALPSPLVLCFAAFLAALFAVAFAAGRLAGPVAPGMHRTAPGTVPAGGRDTGGMPMRGGHR
ncbi:hypothetical protein [Actinoallomurus rhizosphaericola]|uniref:hypothetical protein n=1 Tax=Actinoallomurus rhizosphaericola TaxID=2952536 RepID=UPI0020924753|nr:hypothetical protein [Actinoallomurus rhizosphaericola]MCO6000099.1 hypothetical protein [Actinoallomurus rhizosphaericola]